MEHQGICFDNDISGAIDLCFWRLYAKQLTYVSEACALVPINLQ
jgi:hypothetical protein